MNKLDNIISIDAETITIVDAIDLASALTLLNDIKDKYNNLAQYYNLLLKKMRERVIKGGV